MVGSALVGGDFIGDCDVLRAGAGPELFGEVRVPSTAGTGLRGFTWARARQLDRVTRVLLARAWAAGLGPDLDAEPTMELTPRVDSTVCETYQLARQGGQ